MYRHPRATLASSSVFTLDTLRARSGVGQKGEMSFTHYASLDCSSVIAGMLRAFENGFQRLMNSQTPETESPKLRGELSSIYRSTD